MLNLHPEISREAFEGFGGAVTDAAAYVYSLMNEEQKKEVLSTYFSKEGLGYRLLRVPVDSCDFSCGKRTRKGGGPESGKIYFSNA